MEAKFRQDLPPEGGYRPINVTRNPAKTFFRGLPMIAGVAVFNVAACYLYFKFTVRKARLLAVENRGAYLATLPLLLAEKDRAMLLQIKRNMEEEEKLMANVPGWEVGKLYGEKIYKTLPDDQFIDPTFKEYYAHSSYWDFFKRAYDSKLI